MGSAAGVQVLLPAGAGAGQGGGLEVGETQV